MDRKQADSLMAAMKDYVASKKADPTGVDAAALTAFESWMTERAGVAEQTKQMASTRITDPGGNRRDADRTARRQRVADRADPHVQGRGFRGLGCSGGSRLFPERRNPPPESLAPFTWQLPPGLPVPRVPQTIR